MPIASIRLARRYFFTATESSSGSEFRCRCRRVLINWSTPRSTPRNHRGACRRSPQSERIDWPPPYKDATEKYSSQVRLMIRLGSRLDPEITRFVMTGWWREGDLNRRAPSFHRFLRDFRSISFLQRTRVG